MAFHDVQTGVDIHTIIRWTWADAAAKSAQTVTAADIGKVGHQVDLNQVWFLASDSPATWTNLSGFFVTIHATQHKHGGSDEVATATPAANAIPKAGADSKLALGFIPVIDDTVHGSRGGGSLHSLVTTLVAGFMSGGDKTKLDGIASGATNTPLTASAPANVTKAAAVVGVATDAARSDHKHDVSTAAPGASGVATASSEGSATSLARSDHSHQSNTAPANVTKAAAAIGTSGEAARADHKHDVTTAAPAAAGVGTTSAEGAATSLARSDHTHQSNTAPENVTKAAASIGTSTEPARADHKHDISTAAPSTIGTANSEGAATSLARSDHGHDHGAQTVGTLHAVATGAVAGFMSAADKTKLDAVGLSSRVLQRFIATPTTSGPTTTSATFAAAIAEMTVTITPSSASNRIYVKFDSAFTHSQNNANIDIAVFVDGVAQPNCQRGHQVGATTPRRATLGIICDFTLSAVSHTIEIRWRTTNATATAELLYRTLIVEELAA